jgi:hypothetical protein
MLIKLHYRDHSDTQGPRVGQPLSEGPCTENVKLAGLRMRGTLRQITDPISRGRWNGGHETSLYRSYLILQAHLCHQTLWRMAASGGGAISRVHGIKIIGNFCSQTLICSQ